MAHEWNTLRALHEFITHRDGHRSFLRVPSFSSRTLNEDVAREMACLAAVGIHEVIAVNLTKPGLGIPVVKVVIPGLETSHRIAGYVPGPRARRLA